MIIVINSLGGLVNIQDEDLFQGSTKLNKIDLVAPFADNVVWKANFEMPDGTIRPENLDGYLFQPSMKIVDNFNVWKLPITFPITQDYGIVTVQLRGYIGETIVCTTSIKLPIQKGVPYSSNFKELSDKDQLLQMIADLKALLNSKVDKVNYVLKKAEQINEYSVGIYFVYDDETEQYVSKTLPQDYVAGTEYYEVSSTGRVVNVDNELYFEYVDNTTNQSMKLKIEKDKATLNDKQIVVFDDLKAENIKYDNSNSEMQADDTQEALDELMSKIKQIEFAQSIDLGEIKLLVSGWQEVDGIYQYEFTHEKFTNASIQSLMITPNEEAINLLNNSDILIYPEVDIQQKEENVAMAIIKADSKPTFEIVANFKIMSVKPDTKVNEIKATMVTFAPTDKINKTTVQGAIKQVQTNLETKSTLLQNNINTVENKLIKTKIYHDTTLAYHINEIMKYGSKNENGGLVNLKLTFAGSDYIKGTMSKCEITANGVTFNIEDNVPILDTITTTYIFTPTGYYTDSNSKTLYLSSTTFTQDFTTSPTITVTITNNVANISFEYNHTSSSKAKIYTSEIGISDLTLKDLIITYYDYAQEENV